MEKLAYLAGAARSLLTRKITAIKAIAITARPGPPNSSAMPVAGSAVDVAMTVCVETAIWVNAAATVAVAGSSVGEGVAVASAITGVLVGRGVSVGCAACVCACARAV